MREAADPVLVRWRGADRAARQSADVLLGEHTDPVAALAWILRVFAEYPGCFAAAARHVGGHWCLVAVMIHKGRPEWMILSGGLSEDATENAVRFFCQTVLTEVSTCP
ncbi:hypothetical protein [Actinokineospora iranica]|uniref:Uncharacterized protein n=1 Tax=Actinokineospora iranica TaxID=1271860 RepID=A0A1G6QGL9_9PSEU|nr:hypothetical protein [Actinokineospora iranica]SDC91463.1 hypothetical protein SAMN05216174_105280 [Actinokineospora iranica]